MGIQTAASGSGGGVDGGEQPQMGNLARQGSVYGLTLNEVQNHLGEPLHSMNFDELLRSVLPAEVNEPIAVDLDTASSQYASSSGLQRQGSITMPRALSKKTVDEVWRDIQQGHLKGDVERSLGQERQPTLGEMTLEDFLVKAGVVVEGCVKNTSGLIGNIGPVVSGPVIAAQDFAQGANWFQQYHQMTPMDPQQQEHQSMLGAYMPSRSIPQQLCVGTGPIMDAVYSEAQMSMSSPTLGTLSDPQTPGRKRATSGDMVERRQKRMIKNRESAARSRARKQAYTNELENKVSRLEEENEKLKKQKELDKILLSSPPQEPKYQLRRTSSAPF